jgi:AmmeMemoRadiSam system protein B
MMQRQPAVAGQFYSGSSSKLHSELAGLIPAVRGTKKVAGIIAPHAGYVYSVVTPATSIPAPSPVRFMLPLKSPPRS